MSDFKVICHHCENEAELVDGLAIYPHRPDLKRKFFWRCVPCGAYVGCHKDSKVHKPLGKLGNAEERKLRRMTHDVFDPIWKRRVMSRKQAYAWLARELGIRVESCHISWFSVEQCKRAFEVCMSFKKNNYE